MSHVEMAPKVQGALDSSFQNFNNKFPFLFVLKEDLEVEMSHKLPRGLNTRPRSPKGHALLAELAQAS